ncbi:MAG: hypothetical protein AVDCRST_MAG18-211, partial [uncultured Thermomicrobiales bacterium]
GRATSSDRGIVGNRDARATGRSGSRRGRRRGGARADAAGPLLRDISGHRQRGRGLAVPARHGARSRGRSRGGRQSGRPLQRHLGALLALRGRGLRPDRSQAAPRRRPLRAGPLAARRGAGAGVFGGRGLADPRRGRRRRVHGDRLRDGRRSFPGARARALARLADDRAIALARRGRAAPHRYRRYLGLARGVLGLRDRDAPRRLPHDFRRASDGARPRDRAAVIRGDPAPAPATDGRAPPRRDRRSALLRGGLRFPADLSGADLRDLARDAGDRAGDRRLGQPRRQPDRRAAGRSVPGARRDRRGLAGADRADRAAAPPLAARGLAVGRARLRLHAPQFVRTPGPADGAERGVGRGARRGPRPEYHRGERRLAGRDLDRRPDHHRRGVWRARPLRGECRLHRRGAGPREPNWRCGAGAAGLHAGL